MLANTVQKVVSLYPAANEEAKSVSSDSFRKGSQVVLSQEQYDLLAGFYLARWVYCHQCRGLAEFKDDAWKEELERNGVPDHVRTLTSELSETDESVMFLKKHLKLNGIELVVS